VGSRALHPLLARAMLPFEECVSGTTALLRRGDFAECPFKRVDAECHWAWTQLGAALHIANLADPLVLARRYEGNRAQRDATAIYESRCKALVRHFREAYKVEVDREDAAAMLNFRGPRTPEQGHKILEALEASHNAVFAEYIRPGRDEAAKHADFRSDFVQGREAAIERAVVGLRHRFQGLLAEVSRVVTDGDKSPRQHRSRTPPR